MDVSPGNADMQELIAAWCRDVAPRGSGTSIELEGIVNGARVSIFPDGAPARRHSAGCVQDMLLAALAYELAREGRLGFGQSIGDHLPELGAGASPGKTVRIADLLCHASGLRAPSPKDGAEVYANRDNFLSYLRRETSRFPAGTVVDYDILERVLLVEILRRVLDADPYHAIERSYLADLDASFVPDEDSAGMGLRDLVTDTASLLALAERVLRHPSGWFAHATSPPELGAIPIFPSARIAKDFVPRSFSHGLLRFGKRLWGQNGSSAQRFVALRFSANLDVIFAGSFPSLYEREVTMAELCRRLGHSTGDDAHRNSVGSLNGFDPARLQGLYDGGAKGVLEVQCKKDEIAFKYQDGGEIRCKVEGDGSLKVRFPWPTLWIEPFKHPESGQDCLMMGQTAFVRN